MPKLTRGQQVDHPLFNLRRLDIEPRRDDTALVEATRQFDDNLVGSVVINDFEFSNVSCRYEPTAREMREKDEFSCE